MASKDGADTAARLQGQVFSEEHFKSVLGQETTAKLTEDGGIDWTTLSDETVDFEDHRKRTMIRNIERFLLRLVKSDANFPDLGGLLNNVTSSIRTSRNVAIERIEDRATKHFEAKFPSAQVTLADKANGDQLGVVVTLTFQDGSKEKYFVKTHGAGLKSGLSGGAMPLKSTEPLVYKLLELLGVGCKSDFFGRDERNFYIATRDANSDGEFQEYSGIDASSTASTARVWGVLSTMPKLLDAENDADRESIEKAVESDPVAQNFLRQISKMDLLARVLLLGDLQTNCSNFGFIFKAEEPCVIRILDFRFLREDIFEINDADVKLFNIGNGTFRASSADPAVRYALKGRALHKRIALVKEIFSNEFGQWEAILERAYTETKESLSRCGLPEDDLKKLNSDLADDFRVYQANFAFFSQRLFASSS
jgi:hypothetical protein